MEEFAKQKHTVAKVLEVAEGDSFGADRLMRTVVGHDVASGTYLSHHDLYLGCKDGTVVERAT